MSESYSIAGSTAMQLPLSRCNCERGRYAVLRGLRGVCPTPMSVTLRSSRGRTTAPLELESKGQSRRSRTSAHQHRVRCISALANRYGAIADWRSRLSSKSALDTIYSAELAPIFVNPEQRAMLFIASVQDVGKIDGKYTVSLRGAINFKTDFLLNLSCSDEQAQGIMATPRQNESRIAVVASIDSIDGARASNAGVSDNHSQINVRGRLVDFQFLGAYEGDVEEIFSTFRELGH